MEPRRLTRAALSPHHGTDIETIRRIESIAAAAWPPIRTIRVGPWELRRTPNSSTQRANSALALEPWDPCLDIGETVDRTIDVYDETGGIPRFQISPASRPAELDGVLQSKGFRVESPTCVMGVALTGRAPSRRVDTVQITPTPDATWRKAFRRANPMPGEAEGRLAILSRATDTGGSAGFASVRDEAGAVVSIGTGIRPAETDAVVIFGMHTFSPYRRRGHANRMLAGLIAWALEIDCSKVYLQVEADNGEAVKLYAGNGFRHLYDYHYRALIRANKVG